MVKDVRGGRVSGIAMRIGLLIGGLGQGGAERQLAQLASGLSRRGHEVEVLAYASNGATEEGLRSQGTAVTAVGAGSKLGKFSAVRRWMREFRPDILHGSMKRASSLAALANLPLRRCRVVGSDMSTASYGRHKPALWGALILFGFSDAIVTQTEMNRRNLARLAPWLAGRIRVVRNGVNTDRFQPAERHASSSTFRFISVGTVYGVKNPLRVLEAVRLLVQRGCTGFRLDWYGRFGTDEAGAPSEDYRKAVEAIQKNGLEDRVAFHGPRGDIERVYPEADALLHASLQEGMPNAVIEAMACELPVVVSRVSDLPLIVESARNGYVCDETRPEAIADAMEAMMRLPAGERRAMGERSRDLAVRWFGPDRFLDDFEKLYRSLLRRA